MCILYVYTSEMDVTQMITDNVWERKVDYSKYANEVVEEVSKEIEAFCEEIDRILRGN